MSTVLDWGAALVLTIGGADRSADLVGSGSLERELDAAGVGVLRLARNTSRPALGAAVTLSGIVSVPWVGVVSGVQYSPVDDTWAVSCTDGLQALFEGAAALAAAGAAALPGATARTIAEAQAAAVLALLPAGAIWHRDLHGEWTDGWQGALDALGTVCASIYVESGTLASVPWAGSGYTATISHAAGDIYEGSESLYLATSRELIREVGATVEVGYSRHYFWKITIGWAILDWDFCEWVWLPYPLPTRQMIAEAAASNPWTVLESTGLSSGGDGLGIYTEGLPASGPQCGDSWSLLAGAFGTAPTIWDNPYYGAPEDSVWHATWDAARQWSCGVVETYRLVVAGATGTVGVVVEDDARSHDAPADDAGWDGGIASRLPTGTGWTGAGALTYRDVIDPADRAAVVGGRIQMMARRLRASQRLSRMGCTVEPGAEPALGSRVRMQHEHMEYSGQVVRLATSWDFGTHLVGCAVTIAITAGSAAADDFSPPDPPTISAVPSGVTAPDEVVLQTHIGGMSASDPVQSDDWTGWVTQAPEGLWGGVNYPVSGSQTYEVGFTLATPDVPDALRADRTATVTHTVTIDPFASGV